MKVRCIVIIVRVTLTQIYSEGISKWRRIEGTLVHEQVM